LINRYTGRVMGGLSFDSSTERCTAAGFAKQFSAAVIQLAQDISSLLPIT
jgi:hypothetical protein